MYFHVHFCIIYNSLDMEATWVFTDEWMKKDVVYIYSGTLFMHTKKEIVHVQQYGWTPLEGIRLSGISQTKKDKYHMISFTCEI